MKLTTPEAILQALQEWTAQHGMSWDEENRLPEPRCGGCGLPINVWDDETACPDCDDCDSCCWDNHGGEPHPCKEPCASELLPDEVCAHCGAEGHRDPTPAEVRAAGFEPCCASPCIQEAQHGWVYHAFNPLTQSYQLNVEGDPETTGYKCITCGHGWLDQADIFRPGHDSKVVEGLE